MFKIFEPDVVTGLEESPAVSNPVNVRSIMFSTIVNYSMCVLLMKLSEINHQMHIYN